MAVGLMSGYVHTRVQSEQMVLCGCDRIGEPCDSPQARRVSDSLLSSYEVNRKTISTFDEANVKKQ